ncbi:MAG: hypothetical protein DRN30_00540 [Thermoplasmata archaeon]|nr:MAG: hypothetical protein DRN30_00540 [Thermoplasmata archaeon]
MKIVVIGGMTAGTTAAQAARMVDRKGEHEIIILERERYPLYSRCVLPYVVSGKVDKDKVIEFDKKWYEDHDIDLRLETTVISVDVKERVVRTEQGEIKYDRLIIATGSYDRPKYDGYKRVFNLRTLDDALRIRDLAKKSKRAIVLGAGAIGCEISESLRELGLEVTLVEYFDYPLPKFLDKELGTRIAKVLRDNGVKLMLGTMVQSVKEEEDRVIVETSKGLMEGDLVISALGIRPNVSIFEGTGIEFGETGRIKVNERMETNVLGIYAAGECTEYPDLVTGRPTPIGLGSIAFRQGLVAGINAAGGDAKFPRGILNTRVTRLFDVEIACVGPTANDLKNANIAFRHIMTVSKDLPGYYPGGKEFVAKLLFSPEGKILGYQAIGRNAGLRVNTIAMSMLLEANIEAVEYLETAYSPPVAPIMDPLIMPLTGALKILRRSKRSS